MQFIRFSDLCANGQAKNKRVFIRADLNVPQDDAGNITEDTRIRASLPAIKMALDAGAAVMVTSHLGRPTEGEFSPEDSLAPVAKRLSELLGREVPLVSGWVDGVDVKPGDVVLLENCRLNKGEKKNNEDLAKKMAALCDIFVHDAFGTAHRAEGTTYGIAQFAPVACAGPLLAASRRPFPFIEKVFADAGYQGPRVATATRIAVEIVRRKPDQIGFAVQPRRWVVERFFAWINRNRRLWKDAEATIASATAFLYAAAAMVLIRRIARAS